MDASSILDELITVLEASGVKVRREPIDESSGGLCRIDGRPVLFLSAGVDPLSAASLCARALCAVADIDSIYLRPDVRQFIEQYGIKR